MYKILHIPTGLWVIQISINNAHSVTYFLDTKEKQFSKYEIMDHYTTCYVFKYIILDTRGIPEFEECYKAEFEVIEVEETR